MHKIILCVCVCKEMKTLQIDICNVPPCITSAASTSRNCARMMERAITPLLACVCQCAFMTNAIKKKMCVFFVPLQRGKTIILLLRAADGIRAILICLLQYEAEEN